jgi:endonuclease/exonuclease/phosphatase family metal-dependent hydrolase
VAPGTLPPATPPPPVVHEGKTTIRIASFNIQVFGESKASKPHVMRVLADIIRQFDIVAIQEIRSQQGEYLIRDFVAQINGRFNRHYEYVIGPRLGRTSSKEQYAYLYDAASVEADLAGAYSISDPADALHREPLVVQFRVRGPPRDQAFTYTLVNIHTDPDEADEEVDVMADVYHVVRQASRGEDDVILLGDFNASDRQLGRLGQIPGIYPVIQGQATNTRQSKTYDNIILQRPSTVEFTGRAGVLDVMRAYNLSTDQALDVSDHLPIWAEFGLFESAGPDGRIAVQPSGNRGGWAFPSR